jgi:hypothetical protein
MLNYFYLCYGCLQPAILIYLIATKINETYKSIYIYIDFITYAFYTKYKGSKNLFPAVAPMWSNV